MRWCEGVCFGQRVKGVFETSGKHKVRYYTIHGSPTLYQTEDALIEKCRANIEGRHGTHSLEVVRLRTKLIDAGIDPDKD